jgi:hypothetical protein
MVAVPGRFYRDAGAVAPLIYVTVLFALIVLRHAPSRWAPRCAKCSSAVRRRGRAVALRHVLRAGRKSGGRAHVGPGATCGRRWPAPVHSLREYVGGAISSIARPKAGYVRATQGADCFSRRLGTCVIYDMSVRTVRFGRAAEGLILAEFFRRDDARAAVGASRVLRLRLACYSVKPSIGSRSCTIAPPRVRLQKLPCGDCAARNRWQEPARS